MTDPALLPVDSDDALKVRMLVLMVASRCNLNCTYCYVYNAGDDSWRSQPKVMSAETVALVIDRVKAHCLRHRLPAFMFIFHGGEPLLCGKQFFSDFVAAARRALEPEVSAKFTLQTNGTLLTADWCEHLHQLGITVGVSLDGPEEVNDRHRVDHAGRGSYQAIKAAIQTANSFRPVHRRLGVLTVIDLEADPVACFEHHRSLGITAVDFILPDATRDHPPPGWSATGTPYADWLIKVFDCWFYERPKTMRVRMFEEYIGQVLGAPAHLDTSGTSRNEVLAIQTDGGIEPVGSLNFCGNQFTKLGANVRTHELDDALDTELAHHYHLSGEKLCGRCSACPLRQICGGGYLPWRYSRERRFDNSAVYCNDLIKLITHIRNRVLQHLPQRLQARLKLERITREEVLRALVPDAPTRVALPVL